MASPFDSPAPPEPAGPVGAAPRCAGCDGPLSAHETCVCSECWDELSPVTQTDPTSRDTWEPGDEIPRGLPRPIYKGRPVPWAEISERISPFGDPLESDAAQNDERLDDGFWLGPQVQLQDAERLDEAWTDGLCVLCGETLGEEVHFFTEDWQTLAQGGLHPRCARLTRAHCASGASFVPSRSVRGDLGGFWRSRGGGGLVQLRADSIRPSRIPRAPVARRSRGASGSPGRSRCVAHVAGAASRSGADLARGIIFGSRSGAGVEPT